MFVCSVSKRQVKIFLCVVCVIVLVILCICFAKRDVYTGKDSQINLKADTQETRIAYLSQFGWSVAEDPLEVQEIIIPETFDDTYSRYNDLQKSQGFNLEPYAGKRVKKWCYRVLNYPDAENADYILATLLIYDGQIIGGDICSTKLDGFMHGFVKQNTEIAT